MKLTTSRLTRSVDSTRGQILGLFQVCLLTHAGAVVGLACLMLDRLLYVLACRTNLVGRIGRAGLVRIVGTGIEDVLSDTFGLLACLLDLRLGLVGVVVAGLLDVGADRGGSVGELVDRVLGVACVERQDLLACWTVAARVTGDSLYEPG